MGKEEDLKKRQEALVKMAKAISSLTKVPLPQVAAVLQKYPPEGASGQKCLEECKKLAAIQMEKLLKAELHL
ncbi:hypothetical protein [Stagnihabitans tardus]|uniref:Uncharacterized protein n=1 Tax=Stagnihabitans tardus TaxID=2699202 RepID=A0AAE4Y8H0_9RHOB|nr:hypothetical protein [Stagnihabitans tardus]NBZ87107.1 hypothetical protein [Stagnihabitans tardus]